jgi:hypothetical protein
MPPEEVDPLQSFRAQFALQEAKRLEEEAATTKLQQQVNIQKEDKFYNFKTETVEQLSLFKNYKFTNEDQNVSYLPPKYDGKYKRKRKVLALINPSIYRTVYAKKTYRNDRKVSIPINLYNALITLNPYKNNPRVIIYFLLNYYTLSKPIYLKELRDRIKSRVKEGPDFAFFLELKNLYYDIEQILKQTKYI